MQMADMTELREKIDRAKRAVGDIEVNPRTPQEAANSVKKAKTAFKNIVESLEDIATFLESK